jgi:hypothetical protein
MFVHTSSFSFDMFALLMSCAAGSGRPVESDPEYAVQLARLGATRHSPVYVSVGQTTLL